MLAICLALINDDEDKKSFEQLVKNASYRLYNKEKKHFYNDIHEEMRDIPSADEFNDYNVADLSKAISELEEKYKVTITYFYYYGHNADETAKLMGVSRNAVYKYLRKAEQILFEKLRGDISE